MCLVQRMPQDWVWGVGAGFNPPPSLAYLIFLSALLPLHRHLCSQAAELTRSMKENLVSTLWRSRLEGASVHWAQVNQANNTAEALQPRTQLPGWPDPPQTSFSSDSLRASKAQAPHFSFLFFSSVIFLKVSRQTQFLYT